MRVLVSDTSVLIDLERCQLLQSAFALEAELAVPDLLYERELRDHGGESLLNLGLRVEKLPPEAVEQAQGYLKRKPQLSTPDSFALSLAQRNQWVLLSGDRALRALAQVEGVSCHGVLWLLDQMEHEEVVATIQLREGLQRLAGHPRCRLPADEIQLRLTRYNLSLKVG
jgi:predicted nucleic acid-binding protein